MSNHLDFTAVRDDGRDNWNSETCADHLHIIPVRLLSHQHLILPFHQQCQSKEQNKVRTIEQTNEHICSYESMHAHWPEARYLMSLRYCNMLQLVSTSQSSIPLRYCSISGSRPGNSPGCNDINTNKVHVTTSQTLSMSICNSAIPVQMLWMFWINL